MRKINKFFLIGSVFILAGISIFVKNIIEDKQVKDRTENILESLKEDDSEEEDRPEYLKNPYMEMPTKMLNGYEFIGYLSIPNLELDLPILSSWSYPTITMAPARYKGSAYLNDLIILAHNYDSHFGYIHLLEKGDKVEFKDMDNNNFIYEVSYKEEIERSEPDKMTKGDWDLTLFTCTLDGRRRVTIRCKQIDKSEQAFLKGK